ncbi:MAG: hypothetical protein RBS80_15525 [Thermoguttaceae bacterium]|jgi:hypothetical protein|nr:hypothetical protein [Thermoguttaceae bacterium]
MKVDSLPGDRSSEVFSIGIAICRAAAVVLLMSAAAQAELPENLAPQAAVAANSWYDDRYEPKFAVDGNVPMAGSRDDPGKAWCVRKSESGDSGEFRFEWPAPVRVGEVLYFGRTAWFMNECWKDFEVFADNRDEPVARGTLEKAHGPQRIELPALETRRLTLKFLNSYGGPNPGASEIMVFRQPLSPAELRQVVRSIAPPGGGFAAVAGLDEVDPAALGELVANLAATHGARYAQAGQHRTRLEATKDTAVADSESALEQLQRDVLLFDVDRLLVVKRYEINASHVYTYHYEGQRDGGGLYLVDLRDPEAGPTELVASPDGQILDCDLSYDGRQVLFSWRRGMGEGYHIWKVRVDGTGLTQLTDGPWHDYNACWLPDGGIAFLSTRNPQFAYCWDAPVGVVHRMEADGSDVRCLSANYLNDFTPYVLDDGRIIYSRWEYVDKPAIPIQSLWTINPDGTALSGYFGNGVLTPGTFMEARPIPGTTKILCTMTGHNGPTRGAIGVIDRRKGVNAQEAIVNLTPDTPLARVDQGNGNTDGPKPYSCPLPLDQVRFLVSARGPILVRTIDGTCVSTCLPAPGDGMQWFNAQPVRPRPRPPVIAGVLPPGPAANSATVFVQDVYSGLAPYVEPGEVKRLRVVRELHKPLRISPNLRAFGFQFPVISCGATYAAKQVLGEVPVEEDGSACFRVPANVPIYFMALDSEGRAVQRMRSFTHFMPGEVQGCVGCHENRLAASGPLFGMAVSRPARDLEPAEWGDAGFDYARIVQPVLDRYCAECHDPVAAPGGVDLSGGFTDFFNVSYEVLARERQGRAGSPHVNWIPTYNGHEQNILEVRPKAWGSPRSKLAEIVQSGHPDEHGKPRFQMDAAGRRRIYAWIDLNVPYYGSSETAYPDHPGCRQIVPPDLERVLAEVAARRCTECHAEGKIPRREWVRITEPELNPLLLAPLAKSAGGSQRCGRPVFASTSDSDYRKLLATFEPVAAMLRRTPRIDMPGGRPSDEVCRSSK